MRTRWWNLSPEISTSAHILKWATNIVSCVNRCKNYKNFQKEYENIKFLSSEKSDSEINLNKLNRFKDSYHSNKNCCDNENLNNLVNDYHNLKSNIFCKKSKNISLALYILNIVFLVASLFTFARIGSNNFIFCIFLFYFYYY